MRRSNQPQTTFRRYFWRQLVDKRQPPQRVAGPCGHASQNQALRNVKQMVQRLLTVTQLPVLISLIHLTEQLHRTNDQHHLAQPRDEESSQPEQIQTRAEHFLQTLVPAQSIFHARRDSEVASVVEYLCHQQCSYMSEHVAVDRLVSSVQFHRLAGFRRGQQSLQGLVELASVLRLDEATEESTERLLLQAN
ncbi:hypothetical protein D3C80_1075180 [compost metagenome]